MKARRIILAMSILLAVTACKDKADKYAFQYVTFKETLPYTQGKDHPSCTFDLNVLKAHGADTVFADAFNVDLSYFLFGRRTTDVRAAMITFVDSAITAFKNDNKEQIEYAREGGFQPMDIDYEYVLNTTISYGNNRDIIGCIINWYQYTGGAHGGTFVTCRNYRLEDGSVVTLDEYFKPGYKEKLIPVLEKYLFIEAGCTTREELDEHGYFSNEPMFVPDNFQILQDTIAFIFNQYDIAPYAMGITTLMIPEDEIRDLLRR